MGRRKKEENPLDALIEMEQHILETIKKSQKDEKRPEISKIYAQIRLNTSIIKKQLEVMKQYEEIAGQPILLMTQQGTIKEASEADKIRALMRKTDPKNMTFGKDD